MTTSHDLFYIFLAILVPVMFCGVVVVNTMASLPTDPTGWFRNTTGAISDKYYVDITPAGWAFSIWSVIYIWQAIWIIYIVVNIFRTNKQGKVYLNPPTVPAAFLGVYSVNLVLNITWLFTFDRELLPWSVAVLALITFTAYVCLWISHRKVEKYSNQLRQEHKVDLWLNRILIQNGITIYATWCSIATLLNFAMVLTYFGNVDQITSCHVSLSLLTAELVLFVILDNFVWDKYLRATFMAYPVVIWATTAVLINNWNPDSSVSIFTAVIVGLACAAFVFKQLMLIYRTCRKDDSCVAPSSDGDKIAMKEKEIA